MNNKLKITPIYKLKPGDLIQIEFYMSKEACEIGNKMPFVYPYPYDKNGKRTSSTIEYEIYSNQTYMFLNYDRQDDLVKLLDKNIMAIIKYTKQDVYMKHYG